MGEKGENPTKTSLAKVSQSVMSSCASDIYSIFITELSNLSNSFAKYPCHTELILVTAATAGGSVLFQASIEHAKFWPILTNSSYSVTNLRTF